jgi:hypothetical protein
MKYCSRKKREAAVSAVVLIYYSHRYPKTEMSKGKNREKGKNNGTDAAQTTENKNMTKNRGSWGRRKGIKDYRMVTQVTAKMCSYLEDKLCHVLQRSKENMSAVSLWKCLSLLF